MLNEKQFRSFMDIYGSDLQRWPGNMAAEARSLLERSQTARDLYRSAGSLDRALDRVKAPQPPAGLAAQAAFLATRAPANTPLPVRPRRAGWPVLAPLAMTAAALAVMVITLMQPAHTPHDVHQFLKSMDQVATANDRDIKDADDMTAMLSDDQQPDQSAPAADKDDAASDDMINILFSKDDQGG